MKCYIVCVLVFYLATVQGLLLREAFHDQYQKQLDCAKETGANEGDIIDAKANKDLSDNGKLDAFAFCMLKKVGVMNQDGSVNKDVFSFKLLSDLGEQTMLSEECIKQTGNNVNETARKIMRCYLKRPDVVTMLVNVRYSR